MMKDNKLDIPIRGSMNIGEAEYLDNTGKTGQKASPLQLSLSLVLAVFGVFVLSIILMTYFFDELGITIMLYISGGLGVGGGGYVMYRYNTEPGLRDPATTLLYYRTLSDVLLGLRFLFRNIVDFYICGELTCRTSVLYERERFCALPAGLLEFAEIASEAWFLCAAVDVAIAVTNPFSSFKDRCVCYRFLRILITFQHVPVVL
jgi:hypothetical protein